MKRTLFRFVLIAVACIAVFTGRVRAEDRDSVATQARALLDAKKWAESEKLYGRAILLDPKEWTSWASRAYARNELKNYDGAIADASSGMVALALSESPSLNNRAMSFANRARYWLSRGEPRRALVDSVIACKSDDTFASAWLNRADANYLLGNCKEARNCLAHMKIANGNVTRNYTEEEARQNALKYKPIDESFPVQLLFAAAVKDQNEGKDAEAIAKYDVIIEHAPMLDGPWGNRGVLHLKAGRLKQAVEDYSMSISLAGIMGDAEGIARNLTNRSIVYVKMLRFSEAINDLALALELKPDYQLAAAMLKSTQAKVAAMPPETLPVLDRVKRLLETAKEFKGDIIERNTHADVALSLIEQFNQEEPQNAEGWYYRGRVEEQVNGFMIGPKKTALPFYDKAIALDPKIGDAYYRRGTNILGGFSLTEADRIKGEADYDRAVDLGVEDAGLFAGRAGRRNAKKDYAGARSDLNRALEMEPKNERYLADRARTLESLELWEKALVDRNVLIEINPNSSQYVSRGDLFLHLKNGEKAIADFDQAVALSPEDADYYIDRARAHRVLGEKEKAVADYEKARAIDSDYPMVSSDLANADAAENLRGNLKHMMKKFAESSQKSTDEILGLSARKRILNERIRRILNGENRKPAEIIKEVDEHIALKIADGEDYYDRALIYSNDGKLDLAIADATKALSLNAKETGDADEKRAADEHRAQCLDLRGLALAKQSKLEESVVDFAEAVKLHPDKAEYLFHLGVAHVKLEKTSEAIANFQDVLKIDPGMKTAENYLGMALDMRGIEHEGKEEWEAALADYQRAAKTNPGEPNFPLHEGNVLFNLKKYDEAIAAYDRALKIKPDLKDATENRAAAVSEKG